MGKIEIIEVKEIPVQDEPILKLGLNIYETDNIKYDYKTGFRMFLKLEPELANKVFNEVKTVKDKISKEFLVLKLVDINNKEIASTWIDREYYNTH